MKTNWIAAVFAAAALCSCSQEATVEVSNRSGREVTGTIDNSYFYVGPGQTVAQKIEICDGFSFEDKERTITVEGEGPCVMPFWDGETVEDGDVVSYDIPADAGLIEVVNHAPYSAYVEIESCGGDEIGWGTITPYNSAVWIQMPLGCFNIHFWLGGDYLGYDSDYLYPCDLISYDVNPALNMELSVSKTVGSGSKMDLSAGMGAARGQARSERMRTVSPEKRLREMPAASKDGPAPAE